MKPLIKWPGGKRRELSRLLPLLPKTDLLVEPFFGGGAVFFELLPPKALVNDSSHELVSFYRAVARGDEALHRVLCAMAADRKALAQRAGNGADRFVADVERFRERGDGEAESAAFPFEPQFSVSPSEIRTTLRRSVEDKIHRLVRLEAKHGNTFLPAELPAHYETALQAAYYTAVRDSSESDDPTLATARFYFLRCFCYGSMFRYSATGRFNIPYGGISYNRVDLAKKVDRLFSAVVRSAFHGLEISHGDFEGHLAGVRDRLTPRSLVFLDPPYDTEFSSYARNSFGRTDQERLAGVFADLPCPALLVIQETPFIRSLYEEIGDRRRTAGLPFFQTTYAKTYGYNVRGRNDRRARHLLVGNYQTEAGRET